MRVVFCLLTLLTFFMCITPDASASNCLSQGVESISASSGDDSAGSSDFSHRCHDSDCEGNSCKAQCHGHHHVVTYKNEPKLTISSATVGKLAWYYSNHYKTPDLNSGFMPPIFS